MVNINLSFGRSRTVAIVDVAPGGATAAILSQPKEGPATVLAVGSSALGLEQRTDAQARALIAQHVQEATALAMKAYAASSEVAAIGEVYVIVHAPWSRTALVSSAESYETETRVLASRIAELARASLASCKDIDPARLLEASVIKVELNGYPAPAPDGKFAHDVRVTSIASDCDADIRTSVEGAVHRSFPVARVVWRTGIRALMTVARESHLDRAFLVVDMGVEDTHVVSYVNGTMNQLIVPEGARTVLARVAAGRPAEEVVGHLRMLSRDACSNDACDALRTAMATAEPDLVRIFGEAIGKIGAGSRIPNDVLLLAHEDLAPWFASFLTRIDFAQFTITTLPLVVHTAQSLDLSKWVASAHASDAATVAAALVNIESRG